MPNDSKKLFGKEIPEDLEPISIVLDNSDDGLVAFRKDDIIDETLDKLGDHVSNITKDAGNDPTINPGSTEITLETARGNPAPISNQNDNNGAEYRFVDNIDSDQARASFEQSSNSNLLPFSIRKGKTDDSSRLSGLDVLKDVNTRGANSDITQAIRDILETNNRYAQDAEYIDPRSHTKEDDSNVGHVILQKNLGEHSPRNFPTVAGDGSDVQFKVKRLKNLGIQVLLEASGEYFVPDDTDDFGSVVAAKAASSAPGLARLGLKVPVSRFSVAEIANEVNPDFQKDSRFPDLASPRHFSHGNVNNPLVPFNAVSSTSAGIAAVLLATTISELIKLLASAIGPKGTSVLTPPDPRDLGTNFSRDGQPTPTSLEIRKKRLGSYFGKGRERGREGSILPASNFFGSFSDNFFLLQQTENDYSKAVQRGSEIFFGSPPTGGLLRGALGLLGATIGLGETYKNVSQNPGYFNVLLRMLVKSTAESIGSALNSVVGLGANILGETNPIQQSGIIGALDINRDIGLEKDPTNLLNAINSIRESKILNFMDILAVIGDIAISIESDGKKWFDSSIDAVDDFLADSNFPNPAALVKKDRLSSKLSKGRHAETLAWSSNTIRSQYLLPESLIKAEARYSGKAIMSAMLAGNPNFKRSASNRLLAEDVSSIEQELDACYMPFYFHDLRTNEIVSFHAFMETVTDTFDADYVESEGYGRIGKVYSYKNTNRSIACSFKVVATNPNDFSEMWYKINRLVMLLYPQYTAGRPVSFTGPDGIEKKFIQPFSQLISNSPMIRLRLGDLFKSNFSDFDLARMFGVGTEQFKVTEENINVGSIGENSLSQIFNRHLNYDFEEGDKFNLIQPEIAGSRRSKTTILRFAKGPKTPQVSSRVGLRVQSKISGAGKKYRVVLDPPQPNAPSDDLVADFSGVSAGTYVEPNISFLIEKIQQEIEIGGAENSIDIVKNIQEFFNPEENPIVKSFDSVAGKGLAGFIKRIGFDWADAKWETEGLNNRAPMWCRIEIDFAPVYDINPGIDSSGGIIGPPYNIGAMLNLLKIRRLWSSNNGQPSQEEEKTTYEAKKILAATPTRTNKDANDNLLDSQNLERSGIGS